MNFRTETYTDTPCNIEADFCFINTGDSMINARIYDGDIVYIKQQDTVENGEFAVFNFNGEARIGRFQKGEDYVSFTPANPQYKSIVLFGKDISKAQIVGKAVAFFGGEGVMLGSNFVTVGTNYSIAIGSGGAQKAKGGDTSAFGLSASGGAGGSEGPAAGASGGSGGGGSSRFSTGGNGGSDGGNGGSGSGSEAGAGGSGQGSTTREFGISSARLYSGGGGGGGGVISGSSTAGTPGAGGSGGSGGGGTGGTGATGGKGVANTGGGGGGGGAAKGASNGGAGGSGIVVIRNKR